MTILTRFRSWVTVIKRDVLAVWLAARHPRTPRFARMLALFVAAYALSPIDLIPDFIPVLGYLDDLILVPLGVWAVIQLIPPPVLAECREAARRRLEARRPTSYVGAGLILAVWILLAWLAWHFLVR